MMVQCIIKLFWRFMLSFQIISNEFRGQKCIFAFSTQLNRKKLSYQAAIYNLTINSTNITEFSRVERGRTWHTIFLWISFIFRFSINYSQNSCINMKRISAVLHGSSKKKGQCIFSHGHFIFEVNAKNLIKT